MAEGITRTRKECDALAGLTVCLRWARVQGPSRAGPDGGSTGRSAYHGPLGGSAPRELRTAWPVATEADQGTKAPRDEGGLRRRQLKRQAVPRLQAAGCGLAAAGCWLPTGSRREHLSSSRPENAVRPVRGTWGMPEAMRSLRAFLSGGWAACGGRGVGRPAKQASPSAAEDWDRRFRPVLPRGQLARAWCVEKGVMWSGRRKESRPRGEGAIL